MDNISGEHRLGLRTRESPGDWYVEDLKNGYTVNITDDGLVCWAYLFTENGIVGDVWLYNVGETPHDLPWKAPNARENMPFQNPTPYARTVLFEPISDDGTEIGVIWGAQGGRICASITIRETLHAVLCEGDKPGCCALAEQDGPCARRLLSHRTP